MNTSALPVRTDVAAFVAQVRALLADLPEEDRRDLTEGLESDLTDQLAEGHGGALGDVAAYARELRSAAGFEPEMGAVAVRRPLGVRADAVLDAARARWVALVEGLPGDPWSFAVSLRPAWWVLRAWVALQLVDLVWGGGSLNYGLSPIPSLLGWGWALLIVSILVSVQIGRGRLWPGSGGVAGRVLLLGLNVAALCSVPMTFDSVFTPAKATLWYGDGEDSYSSGYEDGGQEVRNQFDRAGLYSEGRWVSNIYPYDASGQPLVGVQLFDQTGEPVSVLPQTECVYDEAGTPLDTHRVHYPWITGTGTSQNVFPVPSRIQPAEQPSGDPQAFSGDDRPSVGGFPLPSVSAAQLPGLPVSEARTPRGAYDREAGVMLPINPVERGC